MKACHLFDQFETATQDATTYVYTTIVNTLNKTMTEPQKDTPTKGKQLATEDTKLKTKPGPNNPEQAEAFSTWLKDAVDLFEARIHTYDRYETEKAYPEFFATYHKLLSEVEDYYKHAIPSVVLDIIPTKMATMMRVEMAREREDQAKCPDPAPVLTMF